MTARANLGPEWRNEFAGVTGTLGGMSLLVSQGPFTGGAKTLVSVLQGRVWT